jgi:hypothetical protein
MAYNELELEINYDKRNNMVRFFAEKRIHEEMQNWKIQKNINCTLEKKHLDYLSSQKLIWQFMKTFMNSKNFIFYIGNCKASTSEALIRFTLREKNDTLSTQGRKI